ncbi:MAG: glycosyltransferase family 4 protein [Erythrobacter sp.]
MSTAPAIEPVSQLAANARILFVLPSLGAGGSERVVTTLANYFAEQGREVGIANFDAPDFAPFYPLAEQVELYRLNLPAPSGGLPAQLWQTARRISALERVYREFKPDAVISFLTKANVMAVLAARRSRVPVIVSERNNPTIQRFNLIWRMARVYTYPKAFSFVTMTKGAADYYPQSQRPRTRIIPNPVQLPQGWQDRRMGNTITAVGRLTGQKQFHLLIEAFASIAAQFPSWNLTIWGEGDLRKDLEEQRARLGLEDRISLPGLTEQPGQWVETADLLVLSSAYEGWPNVIVEAMAAGLPVISFDCEHGVTDMIDDGVSGRLVAQGCVAGLASAMANLLGDAEARQRLAENALKASERYETDVIASQWMQIVEEALAL